MPAFKAEYSKLIIEHKNPLISKEVRELAGWFNEFYIGIEKQIIALGYGSFRAIHRIDGEDINYRKHS